MVGVRVELLADGRLLATAVTREDGAFAMAVPPRAGDRPLLLRAERLGYAARELPVTPEILGGAVVEILLVRAPLPLPGLQVEVEGGACPARSHPEGVRLWEAMARLHPDGLDTLGAASYTLARTDTLPPGTPTRGSGGGEAGNAAGNGLLAAGQRGFSGRLRTQWERRLERDGYAFPIRRVDSEGSFATWAYAPLEADFASHFGTPSFPRHHRLRAPAPRPQGGWTLGFCPADGDRPGVEGQMEFSADSLLLRVDWRFRTPEPHEEAGGWTRFPEVAPGDTPPRLLPLASVVWRTIRGGAVQRRSQWYEAWTVTPGDSVPFLPDRVAPPVPSDGDGAVDPLALHR
jgi:hypothetical protein